MHEIEDAPGDVATPYILDIGDSFRGKLERGGADWIAVQLEAGKIYEFSSNLDYRAAPVNLLVVVRDESGAALTTEQSDYSRSSQMPNRIIFTPEESGVYYLQPQLHSSVRPSNSYRNYILNTQGHGEAGLTETIDAPASREVLLYQLSEGETFLGSLTPSSAQRPGYDVDGLWLNFERAGQYKIVLVDPTGEDIEELSLEVFDGRLDGAVLASDGQVEIHLDVAGPTRRFVKVSGENNGLSGGYNLSLEYLGPVDPDTNFDLPYDETRPIDDSPRIENEDLPGSGRTITMSAGNTLIGTLPEGDADRVAYRVEAGTSYSFWFTGTGVNPLVNGDIETSGAGRLNNLGPGVYHFVATDSGKMNFRLTGSGQNPDQPTDYSVTLAETTRLDEVMDAPADTSTPYRLGRDMRFTGTLTENDEDWIGVRLERGHSYELIMNPGAPIDSIEPLFRNRNGQALTYELGDSYYPPRGTTFYTANYTGIHYVQPQSLRTSGQQEYEIQLIDWGVAGLSETVDARNGFETPYVIADGEIFTGTLRGYDNDDQYDDIRLNVADGGEYRVTISWQDEDARRGLHLELFGRRPDVPYAVVETGNNTATMEFYAHPDSEFLVRLADQGNGVLPDDMAYEVTLEYLRDPELDEIMDLPGHPHEALTPLVADSLFRGHKEGVGQDFIPISVEDGSVYLIKMSGVDGRLSADQQAVQILHSDGVAQVQRLDARYVLFEPEDTGTYYVSFQNEAPPAAEPLYYELSFEQYNGVIRGTNRSEFLPGSSVEDRIFGRGGDDWILGDRGDDRLYGRSGSDTLRGDEGNDTAVGGRGDDAISGADGKDILSGGSGSDRLFGGDGDDFLHGNFHRDTLEGGYGNDTLRGGAGNDALEGELGEDVLLGGAGDDSLAGGAEGDVLFGGEGNDTLGGNQGWDYLIGGEGADVFRFDGTAYLQVDTISDFSFGEDVIHVTESAREDRSIEEILDSAQQIIAGQSVVFNYPTGPQGFRYTFAAAGTLVEFGEDYYAFLEGVTLSQISADTFEFI